MGNQRVSSSWSGVGPFAFASGYLTILSTPLVLALTSSRRLVDQIRLAERRGPGGYSIGIDDKWLGAALHAHAMRSVDDLLLIDTKDSQLSIDAYGMHALTTTAVWHNRLKEPTRLSLLEEFSRRLGSPLLRATNPATTHALSCSHC